MRIRTTDEYDRWINKMKDLSARYRINRYFKRLADGESITGDYKMVRPHVVEVRFHFGPGYRVYLTQEGKTLVVLLLGGDKSTQSEDIDRAEELAKRWREENANEDDSV